MTPTSDYIETGDFDREYGLIDLLPLPLIESLMAGMDKPCSVAVLHPDGTIYYGPDDRLEYLSGLDQHRKADGPAVFSDGNRHLAFFNLVHELETIGFLVFDYDADRHPGQNDLLAWGGLCATMITRMIDLHYRNLMTAGLHGQVVADSYATLEKKARQLAASEKKYRRLAQRLEIEVEKKTKQIQKSQLRMLQQEKMASIGQLAAGIAHEINNPVGFVISNLNTLSDTTREVTALLDAYGKLTTLLSDPDGSTARQIKNQLAVIAERIEEMDLGFIVEDTVNLIGESLDGARRVKTIVDNMRDFTHPSIDTPEKLDINQCLETTLSVLSGNIPSQVKISCHYGEVPRINGRLREVNQVFFNVLKNALQAVGEKGHITITTADDEKGVHIHIKDSGPGIPAADMEKLFDPFYTTREVGSGTGLGLFQAYSIVKTHGGHIFANSSPGKGATFTIRLPRDRNLE